MQTQMINQLTRRLAKKGKKPNGFTLIELMIVVAIVGVLTAVGLPQLNKAQDQAKISVARQEAVNYAKDCSVTLLTGASAPEASNYDTIDAAQTCVIDVDVVATAADTNNTEITVAMDGSVPGKPVEG